jgi:hypothetical protein
MDNTEPQTKAVLPPRVNDGSLASGLPAFAQKGRAGVCTPWEERKKEMPAINGDEALIKPRMGRSGRFEQHVYLALPAVVLIEFTTQSRRVMQRTVEPINTKVFCFFHIFSATLGISLRLCVKSINL